MLSKLWGLLLQTKHRVERNPNTLLYYAIFIAYEDIGWSSPISLSKVYQILELKRDI